VRACACTCVPVCVCVCVCVCRNFAFLEECAATQTKVAECVKRMILSGDLKKA